MFFRKKTDDNRAAFAAIHTDMHSHVLPGIDDGAPDMETALAIVRGMEELGYKKLIATPHIFSDLYPNNPAIIRAKLAELKAAAAAAGIGMALEAAAEYYLDESVEELLQKKEPLLTLDGTKVLVEFSMLLQPLNLKDILFELQMQGYHPVIAHPERYSYLMHNKKFYQELKDMGCLFQMNILSPAGHYGRTVKELSLWLIKNNYYDLVGTDLHHFNHLQELKRLPLKFFNMFISPQHLINADL